MTVPYKDYNEYDEDDHNSCVCGNYPCAHIRPDDGPTQVLPVAGKYL